MKNFIKNYIKESITAKEMILSNEHIIQLIEKVVVIITEAYDSGNKILIAGNGGSAADAQHIAAELVSKFLLDRPALNAIALATNTSILTAVGNDYNNDYIFSRQVQAYGSKGDVFIAISTSGNSLNIVNAAKEAQKLGLKVVGLVGAKKTKLEEFSDVLINVPSESTPIIQESHIMIGHMLCALVEKQLFN